MPRGTTRSRRHKHSGDQMPAGAFLAVAMVFFAAWLSAEALLATRPHPLHWGVAAGGAAAGWLATKVFYRWRRNAV